MKKNNINCSETMISALFRIMIWGGVIGMAGSRKMT